MQRIERQLLGEEFTVEVNNRVYSDDGHQLAEFDIEIRGRVGSSDVHWLIECRDRPSTGPAPASWVEQLAGRKQAHRLDRVFAVSTTGFSPAASEIADRLDIRLRTVTNVVDIVNDFKVRNVVLQYRNIKSVDVLRIPSLVASAEMQSVPDERIQVRSGGQGDFRSFGAFIAARLQESLGPEHSPIESSLVEESYTESIDVSEPFLEMRFDSLITPIEGFTADVTIEEGTIASEALTAVIYAEGGRVIAQEGEFHFDTPWGRCVFRINVADLANGTEGAILDVLEMPTEVAGSSFRIYGRNGDYEEPGSS